ncbi:MAG: serine hydrolase, partial [Pseudomonadota bacterium]
MKRIKLCCLLSVLVSKAMGAGDLSGVWGAVVSDGIPARVEIRVERSTADAWSATIDDAQVDGVRAGDFVEFATALGTLKLPLTSEAVAAAYWVQRTVEIVGVPYASPVDLTPAGEGRWAGQARALSVSQHLNLVVRDTPEGLRAILRNPELNLGGRLGELTVDAEDDGTVVFRRRDGSAVLEGVRDGETLLVRLDALGQQVPFTRGETSRFAPRAHPVTGLTPPEARDDGWPVALPQTRDVDPAPLLALTRRIAAEDPTNLYAESVHTLVLTQGGVVILEESFYGHDPLMPHDTRSAGKSFASTLVAMAQQQGYEISPSTRLGEVFAEQIPADDARKRRIEVRHLMSMSSGLECDDDDGNSPGNEEVMQSQTQQPDWVRYALNLAMVREPGARGVYCSAGVNLAGGVVEQTSGRWLPEFFDTHFAQPLGIRHYHVNLMPSGSMYLGGGIRLTGRDLAKFGQLMLNDGEWKGERILPKGWAARASAPAASIHQAGDYGWNWWHQSFTVDGRRIDTHYASGNGGQLVFFIPQLDAVFVVLAGNYGNYGTWRRYRDVYLPEYVIPALLAR